MICRECGARIDDDAAECKFCGAVYGSTEAAPEPEEPVVEETYGVTPEKDEIEELFDENEAKRRVQMEKIRVEKQAQLEEIEKRRKDRKRKQRRNVMLIALLVLLLGGAVAAGVYYISPTYSGDYEDDVVIVTQNPTETPEATDEPEETATPEATETAEPIEETPAPTEEPVVTEPTSAPAVSYATQKPVAVQPEPTKKPVAVKTGITKTLKSATITGGEVIKANGKSYMSFIYNNKWYYAKVSDNTTTKFIAWKKMTVNAYTKGETYKGVPVFTITKITHHSTPEQGTQSNGSYIFPNSGTQLLTTADLAGKTAEQLRLARNEIYARHGRTFKDAALQNYFNSCSWYKADSNYNYANDNANLNSIEKKNIVLIKNYEDSLN